MASGPLPSFPAKSKANGRKGGKKKQDNVTIPPRAALPDGSSVDFGHGGQQPRKQHQSQNPALPNGSRPDFGNGSSKEKRNRSRRGPHGKSNESDSRSSSRSSSTSRSRSTSRSSSRANSPPAQTIPRRPAQYENRYADLRVPAIQALPDGSRPDFGNGPSSSESGSTGSHGSSGSRKTSNSSFSSSTDSLNSNQVYAGSSFQTSPSAISLPKPSFSRR